MVKDLQGGFAISAHRLVRLTTLMGCPASPVDTMRLCRGTRPPAGLDTGRLRRAWGLLTPFIIEVCPAVRKCNPFVYFAPLAAGPVLSLCFTVTFRPQR